MKENLKVTMNRKALKIVSNKNKGGNFDVIYTAMAGHGGIIYSPPNGNPVEAYSRLSRKT